jgi:uncharacterized RDD family membrane protein YckC
MADDDYDSIAGVEGQVVRAPEQVALVLPLAGPTSRMLAYAVDYTVILALQIVAVVLLVLAAPAIGHMAISTFEGARNHPDEVRGLVLTFIGLFLLIQLVIECTYFVFWEMTTGGRSLGKAVVGLRVVRDGGFPISLRDSVVRNLLRLVDLLPWYYTVGLISIVLSRDGKRLGDLAAGTIVVRLDRPQPAPPLPDDADDGAGFRFDRSQIARLGPNELALLRQTLRRLGTLSPERAAEVLERSVAALIARIGCEPVAPAEREAFLRALLRATRMR